MHEKSREKKKKWGFRRRHINDISYMLVITWWVCERPSDVSSCRLNPVMSSPRVLILFFHPLFRQSALQHLFVLLEIGHTEAVVWN